MWEIRVTHDGLQASRALRGHTHAEAQAKALLQTNLWNDRWSSLQQAEAARATILTRQRLALHGKSVAALLTAEASATIAALGSLLQSSLATGPFFHWDMLKDRTTFPTLPVVPPILRRCPPPPLPDRHQPQLDLIDKLLRSRRKQKLAEADQFFEDALAAWRAACREIEASNAHNAAEAKRRTRRHAARRRAHRAAQLAQHKIVDAARLSFLQRDSDAVEYFFSEVLSRSAYPLGFPADASLQYVPSTRYLLVDYELPSLAAWPTFGQVRYLPSSRALQEIPVSDIWTRKSYDDALYQICLRVLSELFAHDDARTLDRIGFNGYARSLDKAIGNVVHHCIMSIQVKRDAFMAINLANVDPKACFRTLNGRSSRTLAQPTKVHPLPSIDSDLSRSDGSNTARWDPNQNRNKVIAMNR
jgi:restriction system protein